MAPPARRDGLSAHHDVVVVGAGIAGLGLACALARYDLRVLLLERRRHTGGIHRGDSLLPKTTGMLARWGVLDAIRSAGARPIHQLSIHHHRRGLICEGPLHAPAERTPYLVLPHARIEAVLQAEAEARGVVVLRPARVTAVTRDATGRVDGVRYRRDGAAHTARAHLVVAADGGKSIVREALGIGATPYCYDHAYLGLEAERPPAYADAMHLCLHADGGVLLMPRAVTEHEARIGVGVLVDADSGPRWLAMSDAELSTALAARAPILKGMRLFRQGSHVYTLRRAHAEAYQHHGAVILGDAAHATNPTAGQGMAMALTDAGVLADHLGPVLAELARQPLADSGVEAIDAALAAYEREQWPVNDALVRRSHRLAQLYALRGPTWDSFKVALLRALASPLGQRIAAPLQRAFLQSASTPDLPAPTPETVPSC